MIALLHMARRLRPNQAVNRTVLGAASPASAAGYLAR